MSRSTAVDPTYTYKCDLPYDNWVVLDLTAAYPFRRVVEDLKTEAQAAAVTAELNRARASGYQAAIDKFRSFLGIY